MKSEGTLNVKCENEKSLHMLCQHDIHSIGSGRTYVQSFMSINLNAGFWLFHRGNHLRKVLRYQRGNQRGNQNP